MMIPQANSTSLLTTTQLTCFRGDFAIVEDFSFSLQPGEIHQVVGENGTGKTTLLRVLAGLGQYAGEVLFQGESLQQIGILANYQQQLIYCGHLQAQKPLLTVHEHCRFHPILATIPQATLHVALHTLQLLDKLTTPTGKLSQGQRQRLALLPLWVCARKLWILDEPFAALDLSGVNLLEQHMAAHIEQGGSVIFTSHQPLRTTTLQPCLLQLPSVRSYLEVRAA